MTNSNQNTNAKENVQMNNNILMNGGNNQSAANLFEAFLSGGVALKAMLPEGEHKAIFKGLDIDAKTMTFTIKFTAEGKDYEHRLIFKPEKAEQITWTFQALARQFEMEGNIAFTDYNNHINKEFTVWAVKVDGYNGTYFNYRQPKSLVIAATPADVSDNTEF